MPQRHTQEERAQEVQHLKDGRCPECKIDLSTINVVDHAEDHWPEQTMREHLGSDAERRKRAVAGWSDTDAIETTAIDVTSRKAIDVTPTKAPAKVGS